MTLPLPRIDYADSMERFGNDRPDLRYGMELKDVADIAAGTEFKVFQVAASAGHRIRGICVTRRGRSLQPQGPRRPDRIRQDLRRRRPHLAEGRGRGVRRLERQVLPGRGPGQAPRAVRRQGGRPDPDRRRHSGRLQPGAFEPPDPPGRRAQALRSQELTIIRGSSASRSCTGTPRKARYAAEHHPFTMPLAEDLAPPGDRPRQGPRPGLRPGHQRRGVRRRDDPLPRPQDPVEDLRAARAHPRAGRGEVRLPPREPSRTALRRTAGSPSGSTAW